MVKPINEGAVATKQKATWATGRVYHLGFRAQNLGFGV